MYSNANGQSEGTEPNQATEQAECQTGDSKVVDQKMIGCANEAKPVDMTFNPESAECAGTKKTDDDKDSDIVMKNEEQSALKNADFSNNNIKIEENACRLKDGKTEPVLSHPGQVERGDKVGGVSTPEVKQLGLNEANPPLDTAMKQADIEKTSPTTSENYNPQKTSTNDSELSTVSKENRDTLSKDNCDKNYADGEKSSAKDVIKNVCFKSDNFQL